MMISLALVLGNSSAGGRYLALGGSYGNGGENFYYDGSRINYGFHGSNYVGRYGNSGDNFYYDGSRNDYGSNFYYGHHGSNNVGRYYGPHVQQEEAQQQLQAQRGGAGGAGGAGGEGPEVQQPAQHQGPQSPATSGANTGPQPEPESCERVMHPQGSTFGAVSQAGGASPCLLRHPALVKPSFLELNGIL